MEPCDAAVGEERGREAVGDEGCHALVCDGEVSGAGSDDGDPPGAPRCRAPADEGARSGRGDPWGERAAGVALERRRHLVAVGASEQDRAGSVLEELCDDLGALRRGLARAVDSLGEPLADLTVVVDTGKAEVDEREPTQLSCRVVGGDGAGANVVEQGREFDVVHGSHYPASMTVSAGSLGRISYLGPAGTFTEEALLSEPDLAESELVAAPTIGEAFAALSSGRADAAFVPIENSIEGPVNATIDQLAFAQNLLIQREVVLDVHLDLLACAGADIGAIRRVLTFPHASAQCRGFLATHLPGAEIGATSSTADAARTVSESGRRDLAAIAGPLAAKLYGLDVLAHAIEDHGGNQTRFVLVAPSVVPAPTGHDRTTVVCFQHADRPGSLYAILGQFAARSLNLTFIESRPTKQALGQYCFVVTVEGHVADEVLGDCLKELRADLGEVKFLGSYPVPGAVASQRRAEIDAERRDAESWLAGLRARVAGGT